jgi:hypothetical protein
MLGREKQQAVYAWGESFSRGLSVRQKTTTGGGGLRRSMTITQAMQSELDGGHIRVTYGERWLVWIDGRWTVCEQKRYQRKVRFLVETDAEGDAVRVLLNGSDF